MKLADALASTASQIVAVYLVGRDDKGCLKLDRGDDDKFRPDSPREQVRKRLKRLDVTRPELIDAELELIYGGGK